MVKSVRLHAIIHGRVQGVYFRDSTRQTAKRLGLTGWVRNLPGGAVEVTAEGPRPALEMLLAFLRVGPPDARVDAVDVDWPPTGGEFAAFSIRP
ncbi:MAG: acylphosphatase [Chloroflexi bacterium]|nr:acylphosphatase [Chloroflexota bacterium]MBI5292555.1 acylphosphatase [Chloroflexota bacterium]MBI5829701.1 acylphosphatase [Chloroflexota bacterium]